MMRVPNRLLLCNIAVALTSFCLQTSAHAALSEGWALHRNARHGYTIEYPSAVFVNKKNSAQGDGTLFSAENGSARLLVGTLVNDSDFTPASYQNYVARHSYPNYRIEYQRREATWFVLSGRGGGNIFYEKVTFTCGGNLLISFAIIYPEEEQSRFNPIVERIDETFRPGSNCDRPGMPAAATHIPRQPAAPDHYDDVNQRRVYTERVYPRYAYAYSAWRPHYFFPRRHSWGARHRHGN
jgi:hypothetical protein